MSLRALWKRKRIWIPLLSLAALATAGTWATLESRASTIVVYNEMMEPLAGLRLTACGQSTSRRNIPEGESLRWTLGESGNGSELKLELATEPSQSWQGGYVEPRGGYRVTLRIFEGGVVEHHVQISIWQRWLWSAPKIED